MGYSPWGRKESDMTEQLTQHNQWLGLCVLTTKGPDLILGWGAKIPQGMWHNPTQIVAQANTHTHTHTQPLSPYYRGLTSTLSAIAKLLPCY